LWKWCCLSLDPNSSTRPTVFVLRTDYHLATPASATGNNDIELYSNLNSDAELNASDLYFDINNSEVWFAGNGFGLTDGDKCFIHQKFVQLGTPGVHLYPTLASGTASTIAFGKMIPWYQGGILDVAKIVPSDDLEVAVIGSNFYECNYYLYNAFTFPMLNKINYSDTYLDNFEQPSYQPTTIYTYPRLYGNAGLGNFFPFLNFTSRHFPNHTAHQRALFGLNTGNYVMGGTTNEPYVTPTTEYILLDMATDAIPTLHNECHVVDQDITPNSINVNLYPPPIASNSSIIPFTNLPLTTIGITVEYDECDGMNDYKQGSNGYSDLVVVRNEGTRIFIQCSGSAMNFKLYSSTGALVKKGNISNGYAFGDISSLAPGLYLLEVVDNNSKRLGVQKFIK